MAEAQLAAEGVDVKGVTNVMEEMSRRNRELFALPPWVLYVARAFSPSRGSGSLSTRTTRSSRSATLPRPTPLHRPLAARETALRAMLGLDGVVAPTASAGARWTACCRRCRRRAARWTASSCRRRRRAAASLRQSSSRCPNSSDGDRGDRRRRRRRQAGGGGARLAEFGGARGSTLQDILVDESAKLGDATVRSALRAALIDAPSTLAAPLGLAPPAARPVARALERRRGNPRARRRLRDLVALGDRGTCPRRHRRRSRRSPPPSPSRSPPSLRRGRSRRRNPEHRGPRRPPRRVGAEMLRRSATRFDAASELPAAARDAARDANVALAEALDPPAAE